MRSAAVHQKSEMQSLSPFAFGIGTDYLPTIEEIIQIKDYISDRVARVAAVQQEIEKLEALRAKLMVEIEEHRSLISPIRHLPLDVLQEIFTACIPVVHNPVLSLHESPLLLTRVCKNWRNIMFSNPQFWSAIHIPIPSLPVGLNTDHLSVDRISAYTSTLLTLIRERVAAINEWLERSKGSPLSISVYDAGNCSEDVCNLILDTIIHFSPRWKNLVLDTHSCNLSRIAGLMSSQVPLLESFVVTNQALIRSSDLEDFDPSPIMWSTSEIIKAPNIRELAYLQMGENIADFPLRWSQMTQIGLGSRGGPRIVPTPISLNQVAFILRSCPQLVSFRLEVVLHLGTAVDQNHPMICLPSLTSFSFHDSGVDASSLFSLLELPLLKFLEFNSNMRRMKYGALEMLLPRITTLEWFITEPQFFSGGQCAKLLGHMTSLSYISIRWSPFLSSADWSPNLVIPIDDATGIISDDLLTWFTTPNASGEYPVPSLETFECYSTAEFTDAGLVDFIKKKKSLAGTKALKRIFVEFYRPQIIDVIEEVGEEISKDLNHDLRYPYS